MTEEKGTVAYPDGDAVECELLMLKKTPAFLSLLSPEYVSGEREVCYMSAVASLTMMSEPVNHHERSASKGKVTPWGWGRS